MNKRICTIILLTFSLSVNLVFSQIVTVTPESPTIYDTITLIYDASKGNGELTGNTSDVYMYTGVITTNSTSSSDWKHVISGWCENPDRAKMTSLGNNLYKITFDIQSFYGITNNETVLKLAFLFVSSDCSKVGRDTSGDIFYPLATNSSEYQSYQVNNDSLILNCINGQITITPYTSTIVNIFSSNTGATNKPSYSTVAEKNTVATTFTESNNLLKFSTDSIDVIINPTDLSFKFIYQKDTILKASQIYNFQSSGELITNLKTGERIYGTGSRAIDMDRRGQILDINNQAHYGYAWGNKDLNIALPVLTSSEHYALYFDNHSLATLDVGSTHSDELSYSFDTGQADLFVVVGNNYQSLSQKISYLTGYQPLPPIWSLGYIQSKFGYQTQSEATGIVNNILSAGFPLDALVLDLYWFGSQSTMGNLNWNSTNFPDPETMMTNFNQKGIKTILISEPYFTKNSDNYSYAAKQNFFAQNSNGNPYVLSGFWAGDAALLDIFNQDAEKWFWQFYKSRTSEGVGGWWSDLGEPESHPSDMIHTGGQTASEVHNIYALEWEKMLYSNWCNDFPDKRLFNLSRSGFVGMQRYSTFPWSGDIQRSFDGLKAQIPIMLSMGLTGIGYMHSDIGGFTGSGNDDELFSRWIEMGAFVPILRIHGTGIETAPTAYGANATACALSYIKLRYKLLPYNYTLAYENSKFGIPLARPMDFYEPQNSDLQNINDQYFWGNEFIIAPVVSQGQTQRPVNLPKGNWIEYNSLKSYSGPGSFTMSSPIQNIPILVKAGSFIPTVRNLKNTSGYKADTLFVQYFPDENVPVSEFTLYDDDKTSPKSLFTNSYQLITFSGQYTSSDAEITINSTGNGYTQMPVTRQLFFEIFRMKDSPQSVSVNSMPVNQYSSLNDLLKNPSGFYLDPNESKLYVHVPFSNEETTIQLSNLTINAINENTANAPTFMVYPNPGCNYFIVQPENYSNEQIIISIYSLQGSLIKQVETTMNQPMQINTTNLAKGIYVIQVKRLSSMATIKWIKE